MICVCVTLGRCEKIKVYVDGGRSGTWKFGLLFGGKTVRTQGRGGVKLMIN